jgi:hypothetical protein
MTIRDDVATFPVRSGPYQYVRVRPDGTSETIPVDDATLEAGVGAAEVAAGDTIVEVALSSTSDPDLDPPHGQLWPLEGRP